MIIYKAYVVYEVCMNKKVIIIGFTILILVMCFSIRKSVFLNIKDDVDKEVYTVKRYEKCIIYDA